MAGYSSASWASWCARNGCITKDTPPPFNLPSTTSGYTPLPQLQGRYLRLRGELKVVDYFPQSQAKLAPEERDQYKAVEVDEQIEGEVDGKTVRLRYRMAFVWSQSKARQEVKTRERHVARIVAEFEAVQRNL